MTGPRSVNKHGRHRQFLFLVDRFLELFSSETAWPNKAKFYRNGRSSIRFQHLFPIGLMNMVAMGNSCWLKFEKKIYFFETRRHNELLLCMNAVWEIRCKFPYFVPILRLVYPSYAVFGCDWPVKKNPL